MKLIGASPIEHLSLGKSESMHKACCAYSKYFEHIAVGFVVMEFVISSIKAKDKLLRRRGRIHDLYCYPRRTNKI
jgi:hypothetical protein